VSEDALSRCPACRARFRGARECGRCGADLAPLMRLQARAWRAREDARRAIEAGDAARAHELAALAQGLCATRTGARLLAVLEWLAPAPSSG